MRVAMDRLPAARDKALKIFGIWLLLGIAPAIAVAPEASAPKTEAVGMGTIVNAVAGRGELGRRYTVVGTGSMGLRG